MSIVDYINPNGYLFLFVHKSEQKEREAKQWFEKVEKQFDIVKEGYIDYIYEEAATGFQSAFQYYALFLQRISD